jgi:D-serine deaminase-like pyridoxal phosphate-dependent protein
MANYVASRRISLRPHTKTHKVPEFAKAQLAAGARGITVAKVGEAEVMAAAGIDDILIAYPVFGVEKWARIARLARDRRITISLDSLSPAEGLSEAATREDSRIGILVEFDVGMQRCGLSGPAEVTALAREIEGLRGLEFRGIMLYPGHIWSLPADQGAELSQVSELLEQVLHGLQRDGFKSEIVSGGSTPTARQSHQISGLTEIRPGTYIFNDRNTIGVGACGEEDCALRVHMTVVSTSVRGRVILDGGSKTLTSDRWLSGDRTGFGLIVGHPDAIIAGLSEEHGHVDITNSSWRPRVGDRVTVIPNHVCACVNLHDSLCCHRNGIVEQEFAVAGRGKIR